MRPLFYEPSHIRSLNEHLFITQKEPNLAPFYNFTLCYFYSLLFLLFSDDVPAKTLLLKSILQPSVKI